MNNGANTMSTMTDDDARALRRWAVEMAVGTVGPDLVLDLAARLEAYVRDGTPASVPVAVGPRPRSGQVRIEVWKLHEQGLNAGAIACRLGMKVVAVNSALNREKKVRGVPLNAARVAAGKANMAVRYAKNGHTA